MKIRTLPAAEDDLVEGALWYEERQEGLGETFIDEYQETILRILSGPESQSLLETNRTRRVIRRCFLKRFPYYIAYEVVAGEILILAVAHAKRRPNYWIRRK